jgi:hypothetical protein
MGMLSNLFKITEEHLMWVLSGLYLESRQGDSDENERLEQHGGDEPNLLVCDKMDVVWVRLGCR